MPELRKVTKDDAQLIFDWANDSDARNMAANPSLIDWEEHLIWFNEKIIDSNCFFYILEKNAIKLGVIRFDKNEFDHFLISYSIAPAYRGAGLGTLILKLGLEKIRSLHSAGKFVAYVKDSNLSSSKIFQKYKFVEKKEEIINNRVFYVYEKEI